MLPKKHRLTKESAIVSILRTGEKKQLPSLSVYFLQKTPPIKMAVVVGKKVDKKAVARNKVKRKIREAFRAALPSLAPNLNVVIVAHKGVIEEDQQELVETFLSVLPKKQ